MKSSGRYANARTRATGLMEPGTRRRYRRFRIQTFALTWTAYAGLYFTRKNFSVVKGTLAEVHHLSNAQLGDIDTGYLVAYAVGQFANGALGDRIGGKMVVGIGLIISALFNMLFGVGEAFLFFLAAWTVNGYAQSAGWPGCAKSFSQWFARPERGTIMGLWGTCYQVGPVLSTLLATWLLVHFGWHSAFFGPALLVSGFTVIFFAVQPRSPEDENLPDVEWYYDRISGKEGVAEEIREATPGGFGENILYVVKNPVIWILGLTYVVIKFIRYTLWFWLPFYMARDLGYSAGEAGYYSVAFDLAGILGGVFAGFVSDRWFKSRRAPIVVIMMILLAVMTYGYSHLSRMGLVENVIAIALIGFLLYGPDSITAGVAAVDFGHQRAASLAAGFINGLGSIGAALSGAVVGRLSQAYGWESVFALFAPLCLIGTVLMAFMWNKTAGAD